MPLHLDDRLGEFQAMLAPQFHETLEAIRCDITVRFILLYFGYLRASPKMVMFLGSVTSDAERFSFSPPVFIKELDMYLEGIRQVVALPEAQPSAKSDRQARLRAQQRDKLKKNLNQTVLPLRNLWVKILKAPIGTTS